MDQATISVIIPTSSASEPLPVLSCLKKADYPKDKLEIILAVGRWPSSQRNLAAKNAKGEILYFLNQDSCPEPDVFAKAAQVLAEGKFSGVGGPDLTPEKNNYLQHLFGYAMGSYFAHWKMRARYSSTGTSRASGEKELLLSNLAIKKEVFLECGGFDEKLYPNEENEVINRVAAKGHAFAYYPQIRIYRDRRRSLGGFIKQFYRYGQGRMDQVFVEGPLRNLQFFLPAAFLVYLGILLFAGKELFCFLPLFLYLSLALADSIWISLKNKKPLFLALPVIYILMHLAYGSGMLRSLAGRLVCGPEKIPDGKIEIIKTDV